MKPPIESRKSLGGRPPKKPKPAIEFPIRAKCGHCGNLLEIYANGETTAELFAPVIAKQPEPIAKPKPEKKHETPEPNNTRSIWDDI